MASVSELATEASCTKAYIRQVLRLAFLAPDPVDAILRGEQQRRLLAFPSR